MFAYNDGMKVGDRFISRVFPMPAEKNGVVIPSVFAPQAFDKQIGKLVAVVKDGETVARVKVVGVKIPDGKYADLEYEVV